MCRLRCCYCSCSVTALAWSAQQLPSGTLALLPLDQIHDHNLNQKATHTLSLMLEVLLQCMQSWQQLAAQSWGWIATAMAHRSPWINISAAISRHTSTCLMMRNSICETSWRLFTSSMLAASSCR